LRDRLFDHEGSFRGSPPRPASRRSSRAFGLGNAFVRLFIDLGLQDDAPTDLLLLSP
jgi:hypothetical protein